MGPSLCRVDSLNELRLMLQFHLLITLAGFEIDPVCKKDTLD